MLSAWTGEEAAEVLGRKCSESGYVLIVEQTGSPNA